LDDTTSYALVRSPKTLRGKTTVTGEGQMPNRTEVVPPAAAGQQERSYAQPLTLPTGVPYSM
jgi:hypothetical protein